MAKTTTTNTTTTAAPQAAYTAPKVTVTNKTTEENTFMFSKMNYQIMIAGIILIALGFILMAGGRSEDPNVFDPKEIYSFRRITLAPILVMTGFIVEIVAIMWMPKSENN
jgi:uncharacterized membrane protein